MQPSPQNSCRCLPRSIRKTRDPSNQQTVGRFFSRNEPRPVAHPCGFCKGGLLVFSATKITRLAALLAATCPALGLQAKRLRSTVGCHFYQWPRVAASEKL